MKQKNTTSVNQESTSSDGMARSKPWTAVVRLGERIVEEFALGNSVDTLGRWMAHRVAELMDRAERATSGAGREAARRECSDLIMRLWERRSHWPYGRPLGEVAGLLKNLISDGTSYGSRHEGSEVKIDPRSWLGILPPLRQLQYREDELCRNAAIADFDLEADRKWLSQHGQDLSEEEREILERLIRERERMDGQYFELDKTRVPNFASLSPAKRAQLVHEALKKIEEERHKLLASVQPTEEQRRQPKKVIPSNQARGRAQKVAPRASKKGAAKKASAGKRSTKKSRRR
jgi:hypothetical protein